MFLSFVTNISFAIDFALDKVKLKKETIIMEKGNRMFRPFAYGENNYRKFFRVDLWYRGYRITKK